VKKNGPSGKNKMDNRPPQEVSILADAHVHIYQVFDAAKLLTAALTNFKRAAERQRISRPWRAFLFMAEAAGEDWFSRFSLMATGTDQGSGEKIGTWAFKKTREEWSLRGESQEGDILYLVAGRQIKAIANLEVLALGTRERFPEGLPLRELVQAIGKTGALAVLPWGVGKWLGARGLMIKQLLQDPEVPRFFLGDNRNRPVFWPRPALFAEAAGRGIKTLPGSDPLPLPGHFALPGSYGFSLEGPLNPDYPWRSIQELLLDSDKLLRSYGRQAGPFDFLGTQVRLKVGKRR
jgi:hypothetical protein